MWVCLCVLVCTCVHVCVLLSQLNMLTGQPISLCSPLRRSFSTHRIRLCYSQSLHLSLVSVCLILSSTTLYLSHYSSYLYFLLYFFLFLVMFATSLLVFLTLFAFSVSHTPSLSLSVSWRNERTCKNTLEGMECCLAC